jgi:hypothetical protein
MSRRKFSAGRESYIGQGSPTAEGKALAGLVASGLMTTAEVYSLVSVPAGTQRQLEAFAAAGDRDDKRLVASSLRFRSQVLNELHRQLRKRTDGEGNAAGQAKGSGDTQQTK